MTYTLAAPSRWLNNYILNNYRTHPLPANSIEIKPVGASRQSRHGNAGTPCRIHRPRKPIVFIIDPVNRRRAAAVVPIERDRTVVLGRDGEVGRGGASVKLRISCVGEC